MRFSFKHILLFFSCWVVALATVPVVSAVEKTGTDDGDDVRKGSGHYLCEPGAYEAKIAELEEKSAVALAKKSDKIKASLAKATEKTQNKCDSKEARFLEHLQRARESDRTRNLEKKVERLERAIQKLLDKCAAKIVAKGARADNALAKFSENASKKLQKALARLQALYEKKCGDKS